MKTNKDKMEAIGNVVLNYNYYSGRDLYSEGVGEDILLTLVNEYTEADYPHVIQNTRSWSVMYHLSHHRENICSFLPVKKSDRVLEIGAGCGAITGCLSRLAGHVTCIELSKKRSRINAIRHKALDNIEIIVGNFEDIEKDIDEKYDYITLIGVLEYAESYITSPDPFRELLKRVKRHLKEDGKLVIAIENKLGLKYFAGCKEDHTGRFFEGIEGYPTSEGVKTFSKAGLERIIRDSGYLCDFYYPYPDYKLPHTIYSDRWLPGHGDLNTNIRNFDADRIITFDEEKVFDSLIDEGIFPEFSNSFLVLASNGKKDDDAMIPVFAKYSDERDMEHRIVTVISSDARGRVREVRKRALCSEANGHIDGIYVNYLALTKEYAPSGLMPNVCTRAEEGSDYGAAGLPAANMTGSVLLEYLEGITMEEYLDEFEKNGQYERMLLLIRQYIAIVKSLAKEKFKNTEDFKKLFGTDLEGDHDSAAVSDIDMIFSNILFDRYKKENGLWNLIDYEWTYSFPIPVKFIIYRALYYYLRDRRDSAFTVYLGKRGLDLFAESGISVAEKKTFKRMEEHFQINLIKGVASLEGMHSLMPVETLDMRRLAAEELKIRGLANPKIYFGMGQGFASNRQLIVTASVDGHRVKIEIPLEEGVNELRIDPTEYPCVVRFIDARITLSDGTSTSVNRFLTNGYSDGNDIILYDHDDPQIQFLKLPSSSVMLEIEYEVSVFDIGIFEGFRRLLRKRSEDDKKGPTLVDRVLVKAGRKEAEVIPEGLSYNRQ